MRIEFAAVLEKRLEDIEEAEMRLIDIAQVDGEVLDRNEEIRNGQDHVDERDGLNRQEGNIKKGKGKARISDQHAGSDRPTEDRGGIVTTVPGREQVKRAEDLARQGRGA
jgi:hypothetical protein